MAAIGSLTTRSGKPRASGGAAIRMLGHDVDSEPTRIGDSLRTSRKPTLTAPRVLPERKTGVKRAEVITARVVQDERGWLRLAG